MKVSKYLAPPEEIRRVHVFLGATFFCLAVIHYPDNTAALWPYRLGAMASLAEPWKVDVAIGTVFMVLAGISFFRKSHK